jgi:hypothetical protein
VRQEEAGRPALARGGRRPAPGGDPSSTPEEIEALPKIEELTPETDITAFLRKGVPDA